MIKETGGGQCIFLGRIPSQTLKRVSLIFEIMDRGLWDEIRPLMGCALRNGETVKLVST